MRSRFHSIFPPRFLLLPLFILAFSLGILALPMDAGAGGFSIGAEFLHFDTNDTPPLSQNEFYMPVSLCLDLSKNLSLYTQTELGLAGLPSFNISLNPSAVSSSFFNLSGVMLGAKLKLDWGAVNPFANVGVNLPSGDLQLQGVQSYLPRDFVDSRYQGVTFGFSALAGVELPNGMTRTTLQAGYMDPGVFNQTFDLPPGNTYFSLQSDTFLASVIRSQSFDDGNSQNFGLWAMIHDPSLVLQWGTNFDFFYQWENPKGISADAGIQFFLTDQTRSQIGSLDPLPHNFRGPRFYLEPSIAIQDLALTFQVDYVSPNDYPPGDPNYDGGGWLLGLGPVWILQTGKDSAIKFSAVYNKIIQRNGAIDTNGDPVDLSTDLFMLDASFELGS